MKKIFRMVIFSLISIFLITLIVKGFEIKPDIYSYLLAAVVLSLVYYLIIPILKLILLPLNILTLGLASFLAYLIIFNFVINRFNLLIIKPWHFDGLTIGSFSIPPIDLSYWPTLILVVVLYSTLINFFESIL